jgi:cytochrome c-type biogenesis protein CcmE
MDAIVDFSGLVGHLMELIGVAKLMITVTLMLIAFSIPVSYFYCNNSLVESMTQF